MVRELSVSHANGAAGITGGLLQKRRELMELRLGDFSREVKESQRALEVLVDKIAVLRRSRIAGAVRLEAGAESCAPLAVGGNPTKLHLRSVPSEEDKQGAADSCASELQDAIPAFLSAFKMMAIGLVELGRPDEALSLIKQETRRYTEMGYKVADVFAYVPVLHQSLMETLDAINDGIMRMAKAGEYDAVTALTRRVTVTLDGIASRVDPGYVQLIDLEISLRHSSAQFAMQVGDRATARRSLRLGVRKYHRMAAASSGKGGDVRKASVMRAAEHKMLDLSLVLESQMAPAGDADRRHDIMQIMDKLSSLLPEVRRIVGDSIAQDYGGDGESHGHVEKQSMLGKVDELASSMASGLIEVRRFISESVVSDKAPEDYTPRGGPYL